MTIKYRKQPKDFKGNDIQGVILIEDEIGNSCELQIPFDNGNVDYIAYKEWLADGNTPEDAVS